MLTYLNSQTREVLNVVQQEVRNNLVLYHFISSTGGTIESLNQNQVLTVRYY